MNNRSGNNLKMRLALIVVAFLLAFRITLPEIVKWKINRTLGTLEDYKGRVRGVHLALWRGSCALGDLEIEHKNGDFVLTIQKISVSLSWAHFIRRAFVAEIDVKSPRVRMAVPKPVQAVKETKEKAQDVKKDILRKTGKTLPDLLASLLPFRIREFHLSDGTIRLQPLGYDLNAQKEKDKDLKAGDERAEAQEKETEGRVTNIEIDIKNLTNAPRLEGPPEASGRATAQIMEKGRFRMEITLNPVADHPTFNMNVSVTDINLAEFNPLLRWQSGVDVHHGLFAMFFEAEAKDGGFRGYVKPFVHDLDMLDSEQDKDKSLGKKIKEAVVGVVATVFKNQKTENIAGKVPFEGRFEDPAVGIWGALATVFRNAFIKALTPKLDRTLNK